QNHQMGACGFLWTTYKRESDLVGFRALCNDLGKCLPLFYGFRKREDRETGGREGNDPQKTHWCSPIGKCGRSGAQGRDKTLRRAFTNRERTGRTEVCFRCSDL